MTDNKSQANIEFTATDRASPVIDNIVRQLRQALAVSEKLARTRLHAGTAGRTDSDNGANVSGSEIASRLQGHIASARNFRTHDLEPELT